MCEGRLGNALARLQQCRIRGVNWPLLVASFTPPLPKHTIQLSMHLVILYTDTYRSCRHTSHCTEFDIAPYLIVSHLTVSHDAAAAQHQLQTPALKFPWPVKRSAAFVMAPPEAVSSGPPNPPDRDFPQPASPSVRRKLRGGSSAAEPST